MPHYIVLHLVNVLQLFSESTIASTRLSIECTVVVKQLSYMQLDSSVEQESSWLSMAFTDTDIGYLQTNLCTKLNSQRKGAPGAHSTTMVRPSTDKDKAKEVLNYGECNNL